jgi:hypothetical protein
VRCVESLSQLVLRYGREEVNHGSDKILFMNATYAWFPRSAEQALETESELPFADVWRKWLAERSPGLRDAAGLEIVRQMVGFGIVLAVTYGVPRILLWVVRGV